MPKLERLNILFINVFELISSKDFLSKCFNENFYEEEIDLIDKNYYCSMGKLHNHFIPRKM